MTSDSALTQQALTQPRHLARFAVEAWIEFPDTTPLAKAADIHSPYFEPWLTTRSRRRALTVRGAGPRERSLVRPRRMRPGRQTEATGQETLQGALNQAPPVLAVAALKQAFNHSPRVAQLSRLSGILHRTPQSVAQPTTLPAAQPATPMNGNVVQRMLRTHQKKNDEGTQIDSTGDTGFINDYAKWLAKDTSALVDGDPVGIPGLIGTLKKAPVNGAAIKNDLIDSVMSSGAWKEVNAKDLAELVTFVIKANDLSDPEEGETSAAYIAALNFAEDYAESVRKWVSEKAALESASTVGAIISSVRCHSHGTPSWRLFVYEATETLCYLQVCPPVVPPFKGLIKETSTR